MRLALRLLVLVVRLPVWARRALALLERLVLLVLLVRRVLRVLVPQVRVLNCFP